jgi:predicted phosphate transport protein (TIGR00153 family)
MLGREMLIPESVSQLMLLYVQRTVDASAQALKAMNELDELLESGFSGREATLVEAMVAELDDIEHETDNLQIEVRRALFKVEKELPPVDVMFLYQIINWIGEVADRAQRVGYRLEQLLAR